MAGAGDITMAAGSVAFATANITSAVASLTVATTSGIQSLATEAWSGVELIGLHGDMLQGAVSADLTSDFRCFMEATANFSLEVSRS